MFSWAAVWGLSQSGRQPWTLRTCRWWSLMRFNCSVTRRSAANPPKTNISHIQIYSPQKCKHTGVLMVSGWRFILSTPRELHKHAFPLHPQPAWGFSSPLGTPSLAPYKPQNWSPVVTNWGGFGRRLAAKRACLHGRTPQNHRCVSSCHPERKAGGRGRAAGEGATFTLPPVYVS